MTIAQMRELSNRAILGVPKDLLIVLLVLACSAFAFGLGMLAERELSAGQGGGFSIEELATSTLSTGAPAAAVAGAALASKAIQTPADSPKLPYVASRTGQTYYLVTCKSSERIKPENRVYFATEDEARASGRRAAANCPGL